MAGPACGFFVVIASGTCTSVHAVRSLDAALKIQGKRVICTVSTLLCLAWQELIIHPVKVCGF